MKTPTQPKQLSFRSSFEPDRLEVVIRAGIRAIGCFMLVWLSGWTAGCGFLIWRISEDPQTELLLFAIPFWASWIFGVIYTIYTFLGREVFTLDTREAYFRRRILFFVWHRTTLPLEELIRFGTVEDDLHSASGQSGVVVNLQTIGRPIRFGATLGLPERNWLTHTLNQKLSAWQRTASRKPNLPVDAQSITFGRPLEGELLSEVKKPSHAFRTTNDPPLEPPSDSHWRRRDDFDSVVYSARGRFQPGSFLGMTFIMLFVGGIIGVFMKQVYWPSPEERLFGIEWLYRFLFLKPFELVLLVLLLFWLAIFMEPLRTWSWRVAADHVVWKLTWLGIGFRKTQRIDRIERLQVRRIRPWKLRTKTKEPVDVCERTGLPLGSLWAPQGCSTYDVVCIDSAGSDGAKIEGLTLGDACWIADSLLRTHPHWFG